jgi:hypothetical protein
MADRRDMQLRRLFAVLHKAGVHNRNDRLSLYQFIVCRPITSTNDLTGPEIDGIIQAVENWASADPGWLREVLSRATGAE